MVTRTQAPSELEQLAADTEAYVAQESADQAADAPGAPPPVPELTNAQCLAMGLQIVRETLCAVAKVTSPKQTLDDATIGTVAEAIAPVLDKHGIQLQGIAGGYMLELKAAMVAVPVLLAFRSALVDELRARNARPVHQAAAAAPAADAVHVDQEQ